ncbi:2-C-methyl-D-erythritol 4-phosphate cytidylyltransferase [Aliikangiella marina]|uniref:2-C-methyl-D-erythritol 4-phosphate cytidylyltransferase n=1 Tax=Aliikangiella marina TaxID=1712262 RepID=A0A545T2Z0_9GAMM|nr:2-C-methyl-D-erythritol 4-phosphate cytidylyltransferase [Aliikangiella marina]TQV71582.1 2-C-methyl-D-erythritol 4-phosphate cytidylyltransferase [Aliikangiella marina]
MRDLSTLTGIVAIIPAAGIGERMNAEIPKQYLKIGERTVLGLTLERFLNYEPVEIIVLVTSPSDTHYDNLRDIENEKIVVIDGGEERADSVSNAISFLYDSGLPDDTPVLIHDAARPCVTSTDIEKLCNHFRNTNKACFLAAPVVDTIHQVDEDATVNGFIDRRNVVRALTPQLAKFIELKNSLEEAKAKKLSVTDEVSALKHAGHSVDAVIGRPDNIKITTPEDLRLAAFFLDNQ